MRERLLDTLGSGPGPGRPELPAMTREETGKPGGWDPVFLHSRREALVIFAVWLAALAWAVPFLLPDRVRRRRGAGNGARHSLLGLLGHRRRPGSSPTPSPSGSDFRFMEDDPLEASAAGPEQGS